MIKDNNHNLSLVYPSSPLSILTFRLGGQMYSLPVTAVAQIIEMVTLTPLPQLPFAVQGVINLHGKIVPVLDLRLRFGLPFKPYQLHTPIILTHLNGQTLGLVVDGVEEVVEISAADLETGEMILPSALSSFQPGSGPLSCLAGVATVERQIVLILKVETILSLDEQFLLVKQMANSSVVG